MKRRAERCVLQLHRTSLKDIILQNELSEERIITDHISRCYYCKKLKMECEKPQTDIEKRRIARAWDLRGDSRPNYCYY